MSDEIVPNSTKALLPAAYYEMFGYKMVGLTYEQIAERTGYSRQSVKNLFAKTGVLYKFWRAWVEEYRREVVEGAIDTEFGHLEQIVKANVLDAEMRDSMVAIVARKMIFDRAFGKDNSKVKESTERLSFTEWARIQDEKLKLEDNGQGSSETKALQGGADNVFS